MRRVRFAESNSVVLLPNNNEARTGPRVDPRKAAREEAYHLIPKGYGQLLRGSFEDPNDDSQENINAFVVGVPDMDNARGLERYMSPQHKDERDGAQEDVLEAVLAKQRQLATDRAAGDDDADEQLRNASRLHSRDSKVFARRFGIADQLAVRVDDEDAAASPGAGITKPMLSRSSTNAKKALRQPSTRQLDVGIRSMAASMNAKKASRQASIRKLNCTIRNLAQSLHHGSNHSHTSCSSASTVSSTESFSLIHPSRIITRNRNRDCALKMPGRSRANDCAELIQSALDLVGDSNSKHRGDYDCDDIDHEEEDERSLSPRPVALSA